MMKKLFMKTINCRHYVCPRCGRLALYSNEELWTLRVSYQPSAIPHLVMAANLLGCLIQILDDPFLGMGLGTFTLIWLMHGLF